MLRRKVKANFRHREALFPSGGSLPRQLVFMLAGLVPQGEFDPPT